MEEIKFVLDSATESMEKALDHTKHEFQKVRAGKANPAIVSGVMVDYYGSMTPLSQVASVNTSDARTLTIKPWEKPLLAAIETAIMGSDLGLNPQNDGEMIRLMIPPLTEERRKDLTKLVRNIAENGKISLRTIRKDANNELKQLKKDGASEDLIKKAEDDTQKIINKFSVSIDEATAEKEKEIMTV